MHPVVCKFLFEIFYYGFYGVVAADVYGACLFVFGAANVCHQYWFASFEEYVANGAYGSVYTIGVDYFAFFNYVVVYAYEYDFVFEVAFGEQS